MLVLLVISYAAYCLYDHRNQYDTQNGKRIGTCVTVRNLGIAAADLTQCLLGSTQSGCVGNGTAQHAHQHGETVRIGTVKQEQVCAYSHNNIESYQKHRQAVHRHTSLKEGTEERRTDLQSKAVNEQYQSEILNETYGLDISCETEMSHYNTCKQYECHAERYPAEFEFSQQYAYGNHKRVEKKQMGN